MGMFMFDIFPVFFGIFFLIFIFLFVFIIVKNISQWNKNNHSPKLTVDATVVTKRGQMHRHHGNNNMHVSTTYYATFQFESGDRLELSVPSSEYGMLVEGDKGKLSFQGTRFLSFERIY